MGEVNDLGTTQLVEEGYRALARLPRAPQPPGVTQLRGLAALGAGAALGAYGVWRRDRWGAGALGVGCGLALWFLKTNDLTSARAIKRALWHTEATAPTTLKAFVTIGRPIDEVYAYFRDLRAIPHASAFVESIVVYDDRRSAWTARIPNTELRVRWEAEIVEEERNRWILWRTLASSEITHEGLLAFRTRTDGRTEVQARLVTAPPGGASAVELLRYFDLLPERAIADDLARIQAALERGPAPVLVPG